MGAHSTIMGALSAEQRIKMCEDQMSAINFPFETWKSSSHFSQHVKCQELLGIIELILAV